MHIITDLEMKIPCLLVFSKIDSCPQHRFKQTLDEARELLKSADIKRRLTLINPEATDSTAGTALNTVLSFMNSDRQTTIPAICVSFVEGTNLEFLRRILTFLAFL